MKLQISAEGLRLRLSYRELEQLGTSPVNLECAGLLFSLRVEQNAAAVSTLHGWPTQPVLALCQKDWRDFVAEPENGILLGNIQPRIILEVDKRDRP